MKKYLIILFFLPLSLLATSKYNYFEMAYDFIGHKYVNDNEVALIGDANSFIIHLTKNNQFKEYYCNYASGIKDIVKKENRYYVLKNDSIIVYKENIYSPIHISRIKISNPLFITYIENNDLFLMNYNGVITQIDLINNESKNSNYPSIGINPIKLSYENNHFILQNDRLFRHTSDGFTLVYEFDKLIDYFDKFYNLNGEYLFISKFEEYRFDSNFTLLDYNKQFTDYSERIDDTYIKIDFFESLITISKKTNWEDYYNKDMEYEFDRFLDINKINSTYSRGNKIFAIGESKLIFEYSVDDGTYKIFSAINNIRDSFLNGIIKFYNDSLGFATYNQSMLYITTDGGVTWRSIAKDENLKKYNISYGDGYFFPDGSLVVESTLSSGVVQNSANDLFFDNPGNLEYEWKNLVSTSDAPKPNQIYFDDKLNCLISFKSGNFGMGDNRRKTTLIKKVDINKSNYQDTMFHLEKRFVNSWLDLGNDYLLLNCSEYIGTSNDILNNYLGLLNKVTMEYEDIEINTDKKLAYSDMLKKDEIIFISANNLELSHNTREFYKLNLKTKELEFLLSYNEPFIKMQQLNNFIYLRTALSSENQGVYITKDNFASITKYTGDVPIFFTSLEFFSDFSYFSRSLKDIIYRGVPDALGTISSVEYETESPSAFYTFRPYPNPANNMVTLPFDFLSSANLANMEIKLIDVSGREVSQFADFNIRALNHYKAELEIKLDNIQRGIYFIQMTLNGTNKTSSFIKLN